MWVVFFILLAIFIFGLILVMPIKIQGLGHMNGLDRKIFYSLRLPFVNLACGKILLDDDYKFVVDKETSKLMQTDETNVQKTRFVYHLIDKLKLARFELYVDGGDREDAFATAMTVGAVYSLAVALLAVLDKKNKTIRPTIKISPTYTEDKFVISGKFVVYISLVDIIISKLQSI